MDPRRIATSHIRDISAMGAWPDEARIWSGERKRQRSQQGGGEQQAEARLALPAPQTLELKRLSLEPKWLEPKNQMWG